MAAANYEGSIEMIQIILLQTFWGLSFKKISQNMKIYIDDL